jgi:hypothetical protein
MVTTEVKTMDIMGTEPGTGTVIETSKKTHNRVKGSTTDRIAKSHKEGKTDKETKSQKKEPKETKKGKSAKSYKRGSLSAAIFAMFDKEGVDNVKLDEALKLALSVKKDSKFNKYHLAWYKNAYRNRE